MFDFIESIYRPVTRYLSESAWWRYLSTTKVWLNPLSDWLFALTIALAVLLAARLIRRVLVVRLRGFSARSETKLDDALVEMLGATRWYFYLALAFYAGSLVLKINPSVKEVRGALAVILTFVQCGVWVHTLTTRLLFDWAEKQNARSSTTLAAGISFVVRLLVWVAVLLLVLSNLGIEVSALMAGLGVGGVAAALAVQSLLADVFASLSMYFDRPFDIGDFVIVGDYLGTIQRIGIRTTRIVSLGGEQIVFANSDLVRSRIRNYARMSERRLVFGYGIEYNLPTEKVAKASEIAREVIEELEGVRFDRAHFKAFGEYSLDFEVVYYVLSMDYTVYMERQHAINLELYRRFEREGIPFAFPTRAVHLRWQNGGGVEREQGLEPRTPKNSGHAPTAAVNVEH